MLTEEKIRSLSTRLRMHQMQIAGDFGRSFNWHFRGGSRFFKRYWYDLVAAHKWVFIVGCNNSGTSILQRILNNSDQISTWKFEGQRYTRVLPRAMRRGYERVWMEYADDLQLQEDKMEQMAPRIAHDWLTSLDLPIKNIVLEKTPANLLRMKWLSEVFPNNYFIGIVRNGYAVSEGIHRKSHKEIGRSAAHWAAANKALIEESKKVNQYLEIRYEDFFGETPAALPKLAEFLNLDLEALTSATKLKYTLKTIDGMGAQTLKNMNTPSIEKLSKQDIETIYMNAGIMLDHFGYKPE